MKRKTWTCMLLGLMLSGAADGPSAAAAGRRGGYSPKVGRPHPDFTLPSITDRRPVSLSEFRGKKVLLIHMASW